MNSNKLNPRHLSHLAILIILFIIMLVAAAWVYHRHYLENKDYSPASVESLLEKRFEGGTPPLSTEERALIESRFDGSTSISNEDRQKLDDRFNKKR